MVLRRPTEKYQSLWFIINIKRWAEGLYINSEGLINDETVAAKREKDRAFAGN